MPGDLAVSRDRRRPEAPVAKDQVADVLPLVADQLELNDAALFVREGESPELEVVDASLATKVVVVGIGGEATRPRR